MTPFLKSKVALVSGATGPLGFATALLLSRAGANVALLGRDADRLNELAARIETDGGAALAFAEDAGDAEAVAALVDSVMTRFGRIDFLLGLDGSIEGIGKPVWDTKPETFQADLTANAMAAFNLVRHVSPVFRRTPGARIALMSSAVTLRPERNCAAYAASMAAVNQLVQCLSVELRPMGVGVNAFTPGAVLAADAPGAPETVMFGAGDFTPTSPELAAHLPLWLCAPEAHGITGQFILPNQPEVQAALDAFRANHHIDLPQG